VNVVVGTGSYSQEHVLHNTNDAIPPTGGKDRSGVCDKHLDCTQC